MLWGLFCFLEKRKGSGCVNMSNWLGFSLTPHLRIDEEFGRENQDRGGGGYAAPPPPPHPHPHLSVMPLRSDGSLCVADSFRHSASTEGIACHNQTSFFLPPYISIFFPLVLFTYSIVIAFL